MLTGLGARTGLGIGEIGGLGEEAPTETENRERQSVSYDEIIYNLMQMDMS